jgi:outer membrane protein TolC
MLQRKLVVGLVVLFSLAGLGRAAWGEGEGDAPLALAPLIQEALEHNPEIQAARYALAGAQERIPQAGALEDPMLGLGVANLPTSFDFRAEDMTMKEVSLSQKLPFPGKRRLMGEMAAQEAEAARSGLQEKVNRVTKEIKLAYYDLSHVHRAIEVTRRNKEVLEAYLKIAETRYSLGQGAQFEVVKSHLEVTRMVDELIMLEARRKALEARLRAWLGRGGGAALGRPKDPVPRRVPLVLADLEREALETNPTLAGMARMIQVKEKAHALAGREYYPDFNLRLAYGQRSAAPTGEGRRDMLSAMVEMNLPLYATDKQARKAAETKVEIARAVAQSEAMKNEIR